MVVLRLLTLPRQRHNHGDPACVSADWSLGPLPSRLGPVIADLGERMMDILAIGIRLLGASRLLGLPGELTEGAPLAVRTE